MKRLLLAVLFCVSAVAAERVSTLTTSTPRVATRAVRRVISTYDITTNTVPLVSLTIVSWTSFDDGTPGREMIETWTKSQLDSLPDLVSNGTGGFITNNFKTLMLNRWAQADTTPDVVLVGWKNPLFTVP